MKQLIIVVSVVLLTGWLQAQNSSFNNEISLVLEKVIHEYPSRFQHIKGPELSATNFQSTLALPQALQCTVIENNTTIAWQALLFRGSQFSDVSNHYKQWYDQIKNSIIKQQNEKPVILSGQYNTPSEKHPYNSVSFDLLPAESSLQKLHVELCLQHEGQQWQIVLNVYAGDKKMLHTDMAKNK
jgi:hypothetical protein